MEMSVEDLAAWIAEMRDPQTSVFRRAAGGEEASTASPAAGNGLRKVRPIVISLDGDVAVEELAVAGDDYLVTYSDGAVYRGGMRNGAADGFGRFSDACGRTYSGNFLAGMLHGWTRIASEESGVIEIFYESGRPSGGWRRRLRKHSPRPLLELRLGRYASWTELEGGGFFVKTGYPKSSHAFIYPDLKHAIAGSFSRDNRKHLLKGYPSVIDGILWRKGLPYPKFIVTDNHPMTYEVPSRHKIATFEPNRRDHYEASVSYVTDSRQGSNAGEGLFVSRDVAKGQLVAYFNGVRRRRLERYYDDWSDYSITLNKDVSLDIPTGCRETANYCATSGHKACHSFRPNAHFRPAFHPRFGQIMSVVASRDLKAGDEVLVHYGYSIASSPEWYRAQWADHLRKLGWSDDLVKRHGYQAHDVRSFFETIDARVRSSDGK